MRQLVSSLEGRDGRLPGSVFGFGDVALALVDCHIVELQSPKLNLSSEANLVGREIQAVGLTFDDSDNKMWYAVAKHDKTLSLYSRDASEKSTVLTPCTVYKTPKRVVSLCFATTPSRKKVLVTADLAGDAMAFSIRPVLSSDGRRQEGENEQGGEFKNESGDGLVLLGHTAGMLTKVVVSDGFIITSDRDEKIRFSLFPQTHIIEGFLLGHEAFVTCFDVNSTNHICVSCGGDFTIRLWDYLNFREICNMSTVEKDADGNDVRLLPTKLKFIANGAAVAVLYDQSPIMDIYRLSQSNGTYVLSRCHRLCCEVNLLDLCLFESECLLLLGREPFYVQLYQVQCGHEKDQTFSKRLIPWLETIKTRLASLSMPSSVLERDQWGNLKMSKLEETRKHEAWNNADRKEKARERNKRGKKRRKENHAKRIKAEEKEEQES